MTSHAKEFFISWFNTENLTKFQKKLTDTVDESNLEKDWLSLMKTTSLMRYYSVDSLQTIIKLVKQKWFVTDTPFVDKVVEKPPKGQPIVYESEKEIQPLELFYTFRHTSPYFLFMIDRMTQQIKTKRESKKAMPRSLNDPFVSDDLELLTKICLLLEVFSHNKLFMMQIQQSKAPQVLMSCLIFFQKTYK